jgi:hypothetical protein
MLDTVESHSDPVQAQPINGSALVKGLVQLVFIGLAIEVIYVVYIVAYPLISNTQAGGPAADLEILMRGYRWFAPIYTFGVLLLYYLFWQAMRSVSVVSSQWSVPRGGYAEPKAPYGLASSQKVETAVSTSRNTQHAPHSVLHASRFTLNTLKLLILGFGLLFGFTLVWLYPITAIDLFNYVVRGRVWAVYGESPMLSSPAKFPQDPYLAFAGELGEKVSGYGPLWEIIVQVPLWFGATDMVPGSISLKLVMLFSYLVCAVLIGWFAVPHITSPLTLNPTKTTSNLPTHRAAKPVLQPSNPTSASLIALTFFAWNPLILMQGLGNGHNDIVFMALMVLGIALWQRELWWATALVLTLAALTKISALLMIPLFGIILLRNEPSWRQRILKGLGAMLIGLVTVYLLSSMLGPISKVFKGLLDELTTRRGFAIASGLRMVLREILPRNAVEAIPRNTASYIFIIFYVWLLVQLWRNKLNLVTAGFLAYFSQLMLGATFRIWYPMWLIPLAALHLTPATFWPTFLFSLTAELSIINYFVVWRWWLNEWPWGKTGPLSKYWSYWTIMHLLTIPWLFGIPLFGPIIIRWWARKFPPASSQSNSPTEEY